MFGWTSRQLGTNLKETKSEVRVSILHKFCLSKQQYKIKKTADKLRINDFDVKILFLPVANSEKNPIRNCMAKSQKKRCIKNLTYRLSSVKEETRK